ncbi:MAG: hypothetical protein RM368_36160 [Nostoc sp. DedSLP03]|uniref:hypothetical protein n=1 Tax=Nostoc sp. DedSLP03 TaxID=3075400 RepID=UPI002AD23EC4|nr:hypothetical protein [Nostoc sp. DedSLP03]MDZ7970306.1 hypothetical protein [Nostoc sp. DedSLP03]
MTTTVKDLIESLEAFDDQTEVIITAAADDQEFVIVNLQSEGNTTLNIIIASRPEEES